MRVNLPITGREYVLRDDETIVSKTDLKGRITYVNQDFIRISGFDERDCLGKAHNLVRHPEMPPEAFEDMWRCLKSGKPWTGLVKNRCKNGDHYWVEANAAPIMENGRVTGYTSVRVKASREQIDAADRAYRALREGDKSIVIREGRAVKRSLIPGAARLSNLPLRVRLGVAAAVVGILFGSVAFLALGLPDGLERTVLLGLAGTGVGATALSCWFAWATLIRPLARIRGHMEKMASGDLTDKIESSSDDEVGRLFNGARLLQINVKLLVGQISEVTSLLADVSRDIAAGNQDLSARTEDQASTVQETAATMEQMTSTVKQTAENATQAAHLVETTRSVAVQGGTMVGQVVSTMHSITDAAKEISEITGMIDGIAFQTNILALNAAVEAARAGDQGKGFAVVAGEVRSLAQRSAAAAKEIKELIAGSVRRVDAGAALVDSTGATMQEIVTSVGKVASLMNDFTAASREQAVGIDQINEAISRIDNVTQSNTALVEEAAAAASGLADQAAKLKLIVAQFRITDRGGSRESSVAREPSDARR
jgi:aerotaxis receptor